MAETVTTMELEVDLQCSCCYKKVKELLCKFPQIRNQAYDEKKNTVTITVICCSPEKIRDKLYCKGGKVIKSIKIIPPPEPKPPKKPPPPVPTPEPCCGKPPIKIEIKVPPGCKCCGPCSEGQGGGPCYHGCGRPQPCYCGCGYGPYCRGMRPYYVSRCDVFLIDENTSACTIM